MIKEFSPDIVPKNNVFDKFLFHFILFLTGFIFSYISIIYLGFNTYSPDEKSSVLDYVLNHQYLTFLVCFIITLGLNAYFFFKNYQKRNLRSIKLNTLDKSICMITQGFYSNYTEENTYFIENLTVVKDVYKPNPFSDKVGIYQFYINDILVGVIDKNDYVWEEQSHLIRELLDELNFIKPEINL